MPTKPPKGSPEAHAKIAKARAARTRPVNKFPRDKDGFTAIERAFTLHYLGAARHNASEALRLAGSKAIGQSISVSASRMLNRPHVRAEVDRLIAQRNERLSITAEDVLRDLVILRDNARSLIEQDMPALRLQRDLIKDIGEHVSVGAFRRQVGLSAPNGGPIATYDIAALAQLTNEELDQLERARAIIDRVSPTAEDPADGGDQGGAGAEAAAG